jgi:hypothetical protein
MKEPALDLQMAINASSSALTGTIVLPGGYYVGDAVIPAGHHLEFSGVAHLKGSITIPAGSSLYGGGLYLSGGADRVAMRRLADGSTVLNAEVSE